MVTAILVTLVIIYFFWRSKRERKEFIKSWEQVGVVDETDKLSGTVLSVFTEVQKYYHGKFIWVAELKIRNDGKNVTVIMKRPYRKENERLQISKSDEVTFSGTWEHQKFFANTYKTKQGS
jgi:ribulose bisphosphate carboxylase small subunit